MSKSQAWHDGYINGKRDRLLGVKNEYAYFIESTSGYTQDYSIGYRRGYHGLGTLYSVDARVPARA